MKIVYDLGYRSSNLLHNPRTVGDIVVSVLEKYFEKVKFCNARVNGDKLEMKFKYGNGALVNDDDLNIIMELIRQHAAEILKLNQISMSLYEWGAKRVVFSLG